MINKYFSVVVMLAAMAIPCGIVSAGDVQSRTDYETSIAPAVQWLYSKGLSKYSTVQEFNPYYLLTREQAAKFYGEFRQKMFLGGTGDSVPQSNCLFNDIDQADPTLQSHIIKACTMGIFRGSKGNFFPKRTLTLGEATAVIMRMVYPDMQDIACGPDNDGSCSWAGDYYLAASSLQLATYGFDQGAASINSTMERGGAAKMLYGLSKFFDVQTYTNKEYHITFTYPKLVTVQEIGTNVYIRGKIDRPEYNRSFALFKKPVAVDFEPRFESAFSVVGNAGCNGNGIDVDVEGQHVITYAITPESEQARCDDRGIYALLQNKTTVIKRNRPANLSLMQPTIAGIVMTLDVLP